MFLKPEVIQRICRQIKVNDDILETEESQMLQICKEKVSTNKPLSEDELDELEGLYEKYVESLA